MKKLSIAMMVLAVAAVACTDAPNADQAATAEKQEAAAATGASFAIDTTTSVVEWLGTKPVGQHNGTFKLANGSISVENGNITAGNFTIDVNSLTSLDLTTETGKEKLEGHLKSPDFFDAAKFPTAKFEITAVEPISNDSLATHKISGNLTLKDSTKNVSFPARVTIAENAVKAEANFNIDRTQWGLHYGNDKSLGDKFIRPEVNIKFNISANKS